MKRGVRLKHFKLKPVKTFREYQAMHVGGNMEWEHRIYEIPHEEKELIEKAKAQGAEEV